MKKLLRYIVNDEYLTKTKQLDYNKDVISVGSDYLCVVSADVNFNKHLGDLLLFKEVLTEEEYRRITDSIALWANVLNKKENVDNFKNEKKGYLNSILAYPGAVIIFDNGVYKYQYPFKPGDIVPKRMLVFNTLSDKYDLVGISFGDIFDYNGADCVFDEKELKTRFKEIVNRLVNAGIVEVIDYDDEVKDEIASCMD